MQQDIYITLLINIFTKNLKKGNEYIYNQNVKVKLVFTGLNTMTGGRVLRLKKYLTKKNTQFCLTYGDGLSDINLSKLFIFHKKHKKIATLTTVRPQRDLAILN